MEYYIPGQLMAQFRARTEGMKNPVCPTIYP